MLIWNLPLAVIDTQRVLGEHRELHAMYSVITNPDKTGWAHHPETVRWEGHLTVMANRHEQQVIELGWRSRKQELDALKDHKSPINVLSSSTEIPMWPDFIYPEGWRGDILHLLKKWIKEDFKFGVGRLSFDESWDLWPWKRAWLGGRWDCETGNPQLRRLPSCDRKLEAMLVGNGLKKVFDVVNGLQGSVKERSDKAREWIKQAKVQKRSDGQ